MKTLLHDLLRRFGIDIVRYYPPVADVLPRADLDAQSQAVVERVTPYTMTSIGRLVALIDAVRYVVRNGLPGDFAECGVWRGGSMMAVALTLLSEGDTGRRLHLYDTFEGMTPPTDRDIDHQGVAATQLFKQLSGSRELWSHATVNDVRSNLESTGYPGDRVHIIKGRVEDTIPQFSPGALALLRLDTDWYESTRHELQHLYPLLVRNGVLIIDDYGHWRGAQLATDEYFRSIGQWPLLHRLDYTGRLVLKTGGE